MMRVVHTFLPLLLATSLLGACTPHVNGSGPVERKAISAEPFHGVDLSGSLEVIISHGATQKIEVEAQANLIALVTTEVRNGHLKLSTKESYSTNKPFIIHITVPALDHVSISGSGDVTSTTPFKTEAFEAQVNGSGDVDMVIEGGTVKADLNGSGEIKLSGSAVSLEAHVKGSGDVKAGNLRTGTAKAVVVGSGDITVDAATLDAHITGSGDVKYKGQQPTVTSHITGSGSVRHVNEK